MAAVSFSQNVDRILDLNLNRPNQTEILTFYKKISPFQIFVDFKIFSVLLIQLKFSTRSIEGNLKFEFFAPVYNSYI